MTIDMDKLMGDLIAAREAAKRAEVACADDTGTSNFDRTRITVSGSKVRMQSVFREAGLHAFASEDGWLISPPNVEPQGQRRTAQVEAMARSLSAAGWDASVEHQTD